MATKITLFILDDNIYKSEEFVEKSIYDSKIDSKLLLHLATSFDWNGHKHLQKLTADILNSSHAKSENIITYGFNHPSICLDEIDKGLQPDVIVFDWEYGGPSKESANWLKEILQLTEAFIFVYSGYRDIIPPFLNKPEFDKYASRFQLFLKGEAENSIFTSEEFILQYILSRVTNNNNIKLQGVEINFNENGYLKNTSDILYLEKILGRKTLLNKLKEVGTTLSTENIEKFVEEINIKILFDQKKNLLITSDYTLLIDKIQVSETLTCLEALRRYGLIKLYELLEIGAIKA